MKIENGKLILEMEPCLCASHPVLPPGRMAGRKPCPTCKGTRRGPRGGANRCKDCYNGTTHDFKNHVECRSCNGTTEVPETMTSIMGRKKSAPLVNQLSFRLYMADRGISFNESYLGLNTVFSCGDYGRAWDRLEHANDTDRSEFLKEVREEMIKSSLQPCKFAKKDGTICNHVAVIVNRGGYSLRPSYTDDATDVLATANGEPSEAVGMILGTMVYNEGGNGTLAAAGL